MNYFSEPLTGENLCWLNVQVSEREGHHHPKDFQGLFGEEAVQGVCKGSRDALQLFLTSTSVTYCFSTTETL